MTASSASVFTRMTRIPLSALGAGISVVLMFVSGFGIVLASANTIGLTQSETMSLFIALHGLTAIMSLVLTVLYRQPLMAAYNFTGFLFLVSAAEQYGYRETAGGVLIAGVLVVFIGVFGLSARIAALVPAPIVLGMLGGVVMPFVVGVFTDMAAAPTLVGLIVVAFVLARRWLSARVPAILPALAVGLIVAVSQGDARRFPDGWVLATPSVSMPAWSWQAILAISPVLAVLIAVNANLAMAVFLRSAGYQPPVRGMDVASGIATMVGSLIGAVPMCMGSVLAPLTAGPEAGERALRSWAVYVASGGLLGIAVLAGMAAQLPNMIPATLLLAIAGLALLPVLAQTLTAITSGPLRLGPLFAFVVASSELSLAGFGSIFWALVIGMAVTLVLEKREWQATRAAV